MVLVALTVLGFLLSAHFLIYRYVIDATLITDVNLKSMVAAVIAGLFLSILVAAILAWRSTGPLVKALYLCAGVWVGFLINLLLAIGLAWVLRRVLMILPLTLSRHWYTVCTVGAAALVTIYSLLKARVPRVRHLDIAIRALPEHWHGKTIVHLSDLHLGHLNGPRLVDRIVREIETLDPELVVLTGDLVDSMGGDIAACIPSLIRLQARRGVLFVSGNHETYRGWPEVRQLLAQTSFLWLDNRVIDLGGLVFIGVSYPGLVGASKARVFAELDREDFRDAPRILLWHMPTSIPERDATLSAQHVSTYWFPDTSFALNLALGADLQLSGHTHAGQFFPFNFLSKLIYGRFDHGLHSIGSLQVHTVSGVGTWGPPLRNIVSPEVVAIRLRRHARDEAR